MKQNARLFFGRCRVGRRGVKGTVWGGECREKEPKDKKNQGARHTSDTHTQHTASRPHPPIFPVS